MRLSLRGWRVGRSLLVFAAVPLTATGQAPVEVRARPSALVLEAGQQERLFVSAVDARGRLLPHPGFSFATTDSTIARVSPTGIVTGVRAGTATIVVRAGFAVTEVRTAVFSSGAPDASRSVPRGPAGRTATLHPGGRVAIEPSPVLLLPGERRRVAAVVQWPDGSRLEPAAARWESTDTTIARVEGAGVIRARREGDVRLAAWVEGAIADTARVLVRSSDFQVDRVRLAMRPGDLDTVVAFIPTQESRRLTDGLSWWVVNPSVARVGPTGIVQALGLGATEVIVQGFGQERRLPLVVHRPVSRLALLPSPGPDPIAVPILGSRSFVVVATDADSVPVPEALLDWEVADPAIAEFDAAADVLRGLRGGMTSLTLRVRGFDPIAWAVRIDTMSLTMERSTRAIEPLATDTLVARFVDPEGVPLGRASGLAWRSNAPEVVQVDSAGAIAGRREGRATVAAMTPWGTTVAATIHVAADLLLVIDRAQAGSAIVQVRSEDPSKVTDVLRDGAVNRSPVYSPDRTRIAFASNRGGDFDIFVVESDGRSLQRLVTAPGDQTNPSWMPDGDAIVYASRHEGRSEIAIANAAAPASRTLAAAKAGEIFSHPAVSADGILTFIITGPGGSDVAVMDVAGASRSLRRVVRGVDPKVRPVPLAGGRVLYARGADGSGIDIFLLDLRSGKSTMIYPSAHPITSLAASRDGATLAFVANGRLWRTPLHRGGVKTLLSLPTFERVTDPSF